MQLLTYTDYALRVLLYVGAHPGKSVPASVIAKAYGISSDHVSKATKSLTRHGLLQARRGAAGGVRLAGSPHEIRIGSVVRLFEAGRSPVECLGEGEPRCVIERACLLRRAIHRAQEAFYQELDTYTLADLLENQPRLVQLMGPPRGARRAAS